MELNRGCQGGGAGKKGVTGVGKGGVVVSQTLEFKLGKEAGGGINVIANGKGAGRWRGCPERLPGGCSAGNGREPGGEWESSCRQPQSLPGLCCYHSPPEIFPMCCWLSTCSWCNKPISLFVF